MAVDCVLSILDPQRPELLDLRDIRVGGLRLWLVKSTALLCCAAPLSSSAAWLSLTCSLPGAREPLAQIVSKVGGTVDDSAMVDGLVLVGAPFPALYFSHFHAVPPLLKCIHGRLGAGGCPFFCP